MGSNENLENLLRSGGLKAEPPDRKECEGLMRSAVDRLKDAQTSSLSFASRFDLAYNAAHALALTALRLCGSRSDKRYLVFQCLVHTADIGKVQVRLFALCQSDVTWRSTKAIWMKIRRCWRSWWKALLSF
ncbi:hypothetical protein D3C84_538710 [compost metagenome]